MRVLLVEPRHPQDWGRFNQYHGLLRIGTFHRKMGDEVSYVSGKRERVDEERSWALKFGWDVIYIGSLFSYWEDYYLDEILFWKDRYPGARVVFGGLYAIMAWERVKEWEGRYGIAVERWFDFGGVPEAMSAPGVEMVAEDGFASIFTSRGCPNRCSYCSAWMVEPGGWRARDRDVVIWEIGRQLLCGVRVFAVYDFSFLHRAEEHAIPLLEKIIEQRERGREWRSVRFGVPSGFQASHMTPEIAKLMRRAGFRERMATGVESVNRDVLVQMGRGQWSGLEELERCLVALEGAGYHRREFSCYVMIGLPYQQVDDMLETIVEVARLGCYVNLQRFAPIPGTLDFKRSGMDVKTVDMRLTQGDRFVAPGAEFTGEDLREVARFGRWVNSALVYSGVNMWREKGVVKRGIEMAKRRMEG